MLVKKRIIKHPKPFKSKIFASFGILLLIALLALEVDAQVEPRQNKKFDKIIKTIAEKYNLEASLIHSIIRTESDYDPHCVSSKGALGLMQLMPETAKIYGVGNPFNPRDNIEGGVRYLKELMSLYKRRTRYVLAAYNAGQTAVKKYGGIPPYPETRNYIEKVMASYPKSFIKTRTKVYKYQDSSGRVVFTNCHYLYSSNKTTDKSDK
jgi:soluble lytic murein transglycosylase-like protein